MDDLISGVFVTPLKIVELEAGNVLHALKVSESNFCGFGEAYFSTVNKGSVKGWKCHTQMTLNLVVPIGTIRFVLYDDRDGSPTRGMFNEIILGRSATYGRLTVEPGIWVAFQGKDSGINLLLNVANIEHDPEETHSLPLLNNRIPEISWQ